MEYIKVGQIISFFGIKGEVKLYPLTFNVERFHNPHPFYLGSDKIPVHIKNSRISKNILIVQFEEYSNINEVLSFKDQYLYVSEGDVLDLDKDEFYIHDLIGLEVIHQGASQGKIVDVISNASNDIYVVENEDKSTFMIPAVKEFINKIDIENGIMHCNLIEGLHED